MKRDQFTFYRSYYEALKPFPEEEQIKLAGELFLAVCSYALDGEELELSGLSLALFTLIRPTLESGMKQAQKRKQDASLIESVNGTKNESVPISDPINDSISDQNKRTFDSVADRNEKEREKEREYEYESEYENECVKGAKPPKPPAASRRFIPPTVEEVEAYCRERASPVDAQRFVDFYAASGWKRGKTPIKDWRACVRTWEQREAQTTYTAPTNKQAARDPMQRHRYTQEDYRGMVINLDAEEG